MNKYVIILLIFFTWICFLDKNNIIRTLRTRHEIKMLKKDKAYYIKQNELIRKEKDEVMSQSKKLEKFARENYHMKKDGEEIIFLEFTKKDK